MNTDFQYLRVDEHDGVVIVRLSNEERKNAVNPVMLDELVALCGQVEDDATIRVMILTGSGSVFCSGADIKNAAQSGNVHGAHTEELRDRLHPDGEGIRRAVLSLRALSKPVIAAINGHAVGSGVGLAAGCDIRIAAADARIGWMFLRRGVVPDDSSLAMLPALIGYANAFYWGITGKTLTAEEAKGIGFCQEVVPPGSLMDECERLAQEIIAATPPVTARLFKMVMVEQSSRNLRADVALAARAQEISGSTRDHREALQAFVEKRQPEWEGR